MGKIYCMMGKSSSGKDTIYKMLLEDADIPVKTIVPYTTRPMRAGETEGVEYYFCDEARLKELEAAGKVIELRAYDTVHGIWKYFTVNDHQMADDKQDYLLIGTLESYLKIRDYFGKERVVPIYIEVEDGLRLQRALDRERSQTEPKYEEMCRRFLADSTDFSEEKLKEAGITKRFVNRDLKETKQKIKEFMLQ
ncbi:MAG: guanylate kinase [Clostridiales bacterium]|nr:guanylate kinase [Roseburia sp.]MDD7636732.1 guanylate kinase [Clostridiales bacterium]MDY4111713.1 guanylate kinase [Roseburia sp.]